MKSIAKDYPTSLHRPVNRTAKTVIQQGTHFEPRKTDGLVILDSAQVVSVPYGRFPLRGTQQGNMLCLGYLSDEKIAVRCVCGTIERRNRDSWQKFKSFDDRCYKCEKLRRLKHDDSVRGVSNEEAQIKRNVFEEAAKNRHRESLKKQNLLARLIRHKSWLKSEINKTNTGDTIELKRLVSGTNAAIDRVSVWLDGGDPLRKKRPYLWCDTCNQRSVWMEKFDVFYCPPCDVWIEKQCSCKKDDDCSFCVDVVGGMPEKPSMVKTDEQ